MSGELNRIYGSGVLKIINKRIEKERITHKDFVVIYKHFKEAWVNDTCVESHKNLKKNFYYLKKYFFEDTLDLIWESITECVDPTQRRIFDKALKQNENPS